MTLKKLMISVACTLALSACGGGGSSDDTSNLDPANPSNPTPTDPNNPDGGNSHDYYTINQNGKQTTTIDLTQSSGVLRLSGEEIGWSVTNDALSVTGYSFIATDDEDLVNDIGLILCPTNPGAYQGDAKHVVVPRAAASGAIANLSGKTFYELGDCSGTPSATFTFASDGSLHVVEPGEPDSNLSASDVVNLFSSNGYRGAADEPLTFGYIYTVSGVPLVVLNSPDTEDPWLGVLVPTDAVN